jgi:hypothetical protein
LPYEGFGENSEKGLERDSDERVLKGVRVLVKIRRKKYGEMGKDSRNIQERILGEGSRKSSERGIWTHFRKRNMHRFQRKGTVENHQKRYRKY